jgi:hypothetical protein
LCALTTQVDVDGRCPLPPRPWRHRSQVLRIWRGPGGGTARSHR